MKFDLIISLATLNLQKTNFLNILNRNIKETKRDFEYEIKTKRLLSLKTALDNLTQM